MEMTRFSLSPALLASVFNLEPDDDEFSEANA